MPAVGIEVFSASYLFAASWPGDGACLQRSLVGYISWGFKELDMNARPARSLSSSCWAYFSGIMVSPRIQRAVVVKRRPPNSDHNLFWGENLALGSALELLHSPTTKLVVPSCCMIYAFCHKSQSNHEMVHCCCTG